MRMHATMLQFHCSVSCASPAKSVGWYWTIREEGNEMTKEKEKIDKGMMPNLPSTPVRIVGPFPRGSGDGNTLVIVNQSK